MAAIERIKALLLCGKKVRLVDGELHPDAVLLSVKKLFTTRKYLWATSTETMPDVYIETGLRTYPLFCCVMGEAFVRKIDLPDIPAKQVVDGDGTIKTVITPDALLDNARLAKVAQGTFADAYVDKPDTTQDLLLGMVMGGFYTVLFTRPEWLQNPIVSTVMFGVLFALIFLVSRR